MKLGYRNSRIKIFLVEWCICMLLLAGCQNTPSISTQAPDSPSLPTVHPVFNVIPTMTTNPLPTFAPTYTIGPTATDMALEDELPPVLEETPESQAPTQTQTPQATPARDNPSGELVLVDIPIYSDQTNSNWILHSGAGVFYVFQEAMEVHDGKYVFGLTFQKDDGYFDFHVRQGTTTEFLRDDTYGVHFWIYSVSQPLARRDIGVGIYGSNDVPHMSSNDASVDQTQFDPFFGNNEDAYLIGLNRDLPANTWIEIELPLDSLEYDTNYTYITGIRFRNNSGFKGKILIDNLSLLQYAPEE